MENTKEDSNPSKNKENTTKVIDPLQEKFQNLPPKVYQILSYEQRHLDTCPICKEKYNIAKKRPRILVNCGHTFCNSCLKKYYHNENHIRCPYCKKLLANIKKVEDLPINLPVFCELVKNDPVIMLMIDPDSDISCYSNCFTHPSLRKEYYCSFHETCFCEKCAGAFHQNKKCTIIKDLDYVGQLYHLYEENIRTNKLIVKLRNKGKGKMKQEEFFVANAC